MRRIGVVSGFSAADSVLGFLYGGIFAYVMVQLLSDTQPTLTYELVQEWSAVFEWGTGMIVGALIGVSSTSRASRSPKPFGNSSGQEESIRSFERILRFDSTHQRSGASGC